MATIIDKTAKAKETIDEVNDFIETTREVESYKKLWSYEERQKMEPSECKRLSQNMSQLMQIKDLTSLRAKEMTSSGKAEFLVPQFIIGPTLEGMAPELQISSMFSKIQYAGGQIYQFPALGEVRAGVIGEGAEYPEQDFDMSQYRNLSIKVEKHGLMLKITQEAIMNNQWDVMAYLLRAAGRALGRLKEEQCIVAMLKHAHPLFDALSTDPHYQPSGVDIHNNLNNTLGVMDFCDILGAAMYNEKNINTVIMHPLAAMTFFKNELLGAYGRGLINYQHPWQTPLASAASQGVSYADVANIIGRNLPIPVTPIITPYAPLDRVNKRFDMLFVDSKNIGVIIQQEEVSTEDFDEPKRDIHCVKIKEFYGVGIADQGRGIITVKNLALAPTYFPPLRVETVN